MTFEFDSEVQASVAGAPVIDLSDIPAFQAAMAAAPAAPPFVPAAGVDVTTVHATGDAPVDVIVVRPEGAGPRPLVLWFHGGGFVMGDASESVPFLDRAAREVGVVGASIQYDLAPAATYPTPIDQGVTALTWLLANADEFGIDPTRIVVGGQSAGAAHAITLALRLRDEGGPRVALQLLDIPVTDDLGGKELLLRGRAAARPAVDARTLP